MCGVAKEHTLSVSKFNLDIFEIKKMKTKSDGVTLPPATVTAVAIEI